MAPCHASRTSLAPSGAASRDALDTGKILAVTGPAADQGADIAGAFPPDPLRELLNARQQVFVLRQARNAKLEETGLPGAQYFAGAALAQVFLGDVKSIVAFAQHLESRQALRAQGRLVQKYTVTELAATADAPP